VQPPGLDSGSVGSPSLIADMLVACSYVGRTQGPRFVAFFGCMYYAMMRPSKVGHAVRPCSRCPGRTATFQPPTRRGYPWSAMLLAPAATPSAARSIPPTSACRCRSSPRGTLGFTGHARVTVTLPPIPSANLTEEPGRDTPSRPAGQSRTPPEPTPGARSASTWPGRTVPGRSGVKQRLLVGHQPCAIRLTRSELHRGFVVHGDPADRFTVRSKQVMSARRTDDARRPAGTPIRHWPSRARARVAHRHPAQEPQCHPVRRNPGGGEPARAAAYRTRPMTEPITAV
jgi:hypothetical protein